MQLLKSHPQMPHRLKPQGGRFRKLERKEVSGFIPLHLHLEIKADVAHAKKKVLLV